MFWNRKLVIQHVMFTCYQYFNTWYSYQVIRVNLFQIWSVSIFWHIVRRAFHESNMNPFPRVSLFFSDVQYSAAIAALESVEMKGGITLFSSGCHYCASSFYKALIRFYASLNPCYFSEVCDIKSLKFMLDIFVLLCFF